MGVLLLFLQDIQKLQIGKMLLIGLILLGYLVLALSLWPGNHDGNQVRNNHNCTLVDTLNMTAFNSYTCFDTEIVLQTDPLGDGDAYEVYDCVNPTFITGLIAYNIQDYVSTAVLFFVPLTLGYIATYIPRYWLKGYALLLQGVFPQYYGHYTGLAIALEVCMLSACCAAYLYYAFFTQGSCLLIQAYSEVGWFIFMLSLCVGVMIGAAYIVHQTLYKNWKSVHQLLSHKEIILLPMPHTRFFHLNYESHPEHHSLTDEEQKLTTRIWHGLKLNMQDDTNDRVEATTLLVETMIREMYPLFTSLHVTPWLTRHGNFLPLTFITELLTFGGFVVFVINYTRDTRWLVLMWTCVGISFLTYYTVTMEILLKRSIPRSNCGKKLFNLLQIVLILILTGGTVFCFYKAHVVRSSLNAEIFHKTAIFGCVVIGFFIIRLFIMRPCCCCCGKNRQAHGQEWLLGHPSGGNED